MWPVLLGLQLLATADAPPAPPAHASSYSYTYRCDSRTSRARVTIVTPAAPEAAEAPEAPQAPDAPTWSINGIAPTGVLEFAYPAGGPRVYPARSETLLNVPRGTLLELSSFAGDIDVEGWDKNSVHVIASHGRRDRLEARLVRGTLVLETSNAAGLPTVVGYQIRVPRWMPLHLSGIDSQISVSGVLSPISAESVKGDVTVRGGSGQMQLSSVEGGIHVLDARGALQATSVNNLVQIQRVVGDLSLESVNGDIQMHGCDSPNVEASSVNGMVVFSGPFQRRGRYRLASHNGRLVVGVPDDAGVDVSVASFNGTFESGFPVQVGRKIKNRKFGFTIGSGGSSLELESYQGLIQLLRPRALPAPPAPLSPKAPLPPVPPEER